MGRITIEGTVTPSTYLATGARLTVDRTALIDKMIRNGYVKVVSILPEIITAPAAVIREIEQTYAEQVETTDRERQLSGAPARNAARDVWAKWLQEKNITSPADATRNDLIALWDARTDSEPEDG